jgi:diguanylate cyclase (GGDEF)-like protein
VDVDHFKQFNDTYGHPAGDRVLVEVAAILRDNLRGTDVIGRYGGEEFAILLVDATQDAALRVAEKLRNAIRDYAFETPDGSARQITISIGVGTFPLDARLPADLVVRADDALYRAKSLGRDRVVA